MQTERRVRLGEAQASPFVREINEMDPVLIAGIVIVLIALGAAILLYDELASH